MELIKKHLTVRDIQAFYENCGLFLSFKDNNIENEEIKKKLQEIDQFNTKTINDTNIVEKLSNSQGIWLDSKLKMISYNIKGGVSKLNIIINY